MIGELGQAGMAIGHPGGSPGSISAVCRFADRFVPCTISAFAKNNAAGVAEFEVVRLAPLMRKSVGPQVSCQHARNFKFKRVQCGSPKALRG